MKNNKDGLSIISSTCGADLISNKTLKHSNSTNRCRSLAGGSGLKHSVSYDSEVNGLCPLRSCILEAISSF